jgi:hypothetical protein
MSGRKKGWMYFVKIPQLVGSYSYMKIPQLRKGKDAWFPPYGTKFQDAWQLAKFPSTR